ncbi:helix-turn-helix domain-containing protein [Sediminivirga luteola]|uniref:helix-turn-helix domain-containing protein n=1 Tax=Sediminivirga luteola TaxID=1774748 RepID=UPI001F56E3BE
MRVDVHASTARPGAGEGGPDPGGEQVDRRALPVLAAGAVEVPYVISGMDEIVSQDTFWEPHAHPTHELLWNLRGASTATVGSRTWTITPAVGLWIPAGTVHTGQAAAGTWYRAAQFGVHAAPSLSDVPVAVEVTTLLRCLLERLDDESLPADSRELTERLVLDVLAPSPHELLVQRPEHRLLAPIADALLADPADRRTLSDWARQCGVSPRTITRAFAAETGLNFSRWQSAVRTQRAVMLLTRGGTVEETAARLGYSSASAFGVAFRRVTGQTPGSFTVRQGQATADR